MVDLVQIKIDKGVADVRLNRPEKYNALNSDMFSAINEATENLRNMSELRAVVLSGNGAGFCAGLDMASFQSMSDNSNNNLQKTLDSKNDGPENEVQRPAYGWKELPVPVIAAIHGVAYGGGCQIALGADIRFAAPESKISILEIKWGLIPDMSITQSLRDLVPQDIAKELTFTGRVLDGREANAIGLVTHVSEDPLSSAMELAREIAQKSPDAVRAAKRLYQETWHADTKTGLALEASLQKSLLGTKNQIEAIMANFEERDANFEDR
tara:strand:- start:1618 stop:2421 length:804 start_codon:yes stop_codon:yes gene_type:complete